MSISLKRFGPDQWDKFSLIMASTVPVGLAVGNVGFELLVGFTVLGWFFRCLSAGENPIPGLIKHPLVIPWLAWYAAIVVSLCFNGAGNKGWLHDLAFFRFVLYGMALLDISKRLPVAKYLLYGLAAGVIWAALNTLSAYILGFDFLGRPIIRYAGKLKEAGRISGVASYAAAFFLSWGILDHRLSSKNRTIIIIFGLTAFAQLLQAHVRTAIIAAVVGLMFSLVILNRKRVSFWVTGSCSVGLLLAVALIFYFGESWFGNMLSLASIYDRIYFWKVSWKMWLDHPILGVSVSAFQDVYKEIALSGEVAPFVAPNNQVFNYVDVMHAHNIVLMLASSTGLTGLICFIWLFVRGVRTIFRDISGFRIGFAAWPVVFLVIGMTGFNIYHSWYQALLAFWLAFIGTREVSVPKTSSATNEEIRHLNGWPCKD